ncbi:MAG: hypothetical protein O7D29_03095 [Gemmatimonadetes bacterium]|nr:hypothetical protein [Gemmatimonadota bacterium]
MTRHRDLAVQMALLLTPIACAEESSLSARAHPYDEGVLTEAQLFAAGTVSTELPEFATSFSPDGETVYFNVAAPDRSSVTIMYSRYRDSAWSPPEPVTFSGEYFDVDAFVTLEGDRVYFSSSRPTGEDDAETDFNTWFVEVRNQGWTEPTLLGEPFNTKSTEVFVSLTRDGSIYFASDRDGESHIYRATIGDPGAGAVRVPFDLNEVGGTGNPLISPDGMLLVFAAEREGGPGGSDLYVTRRTGDEWSPAQLIGGNGGSGGNVNSFFTDFAPGWSPDGRYLFFTSERPGIMPAVPEGVRPPGDIYQISLETIGLP